MNSQSIPKERRKIIIIIIIIICVMYTGKRKKEKESVHWEFVKYPAFVSQLFVFLFFV